YIPETSGISESESRQLLAEAKFFRAFNYFFLVKTFGGVPLITKPYTNTEGIYVERSPAEAIYALIVDDLNAAVEGGLGTTPFPMNGFRITRGAAATLLADVQLQMAGYPLQVQESYAKAATA